MKNKRIFGLLALLVSLSSCNLLNQGSSGSPSVSDDTTDDSSGTISVEEGLQYDGSIAVLSSGSLKSSGILKNAESTKQLVLISGPIGPNVGDVLYNFEMDRFPKTLEEEIKVAHMASYTFPWLLEQCSTTHYQDYPKITVEKEGLTLTQDELLTNFSEVARCSYEKFMSKPYWIPQLINDVDICGMELGKEWRLITEEDVLALTQDDLQYINDTLSGAAGNFWASFYVGMTVYVRSGKTIKQADLSAPEKGAIVSDLPIKPEFWKAHLEGARTLRCIKVTDL